MNENEFLLADRLAIIHDTILKYGEENFYESFSGGKDSTVVSWMLDQAVPGNRIPRVFINTGIEFNETVRFVREKQSKDDRIIIVKPQVNIAEALKRDGYPFKSKHHSRMVSEYQNGKHSKLLEYYTSNAKSLFTCPDCLKYQFRENGAMKISDQCCIDMKEKPLSVWAKENKKSVAITGLMASEGGRRENGKDCAVFKNGKLAYFHPLKPVNDEFVSWVIQKNCIQISKLYGEPYNFKRTGCKGCPFNINLQTELDVLEKYMPNERRQCEIIWKPVYAEYRRIGYRLNPYDQMKLEIEEKEDIK